MVGNGQKVNADGITDIPLGNVKLQNVLVSPHISANLISVSQALDNGIDEVSFKPTVFG